jgi:O-acetyl-ADP-ribose deacetylase (regulator of RNase III)
MSKEKKVGNTVIRAVVGDITDMEVEAFVYDITADAKLGTGYGGAITARGGKSVQDELDAIGSCPTGEAIITSAGKMPVKHIIHLNGPKFHEPDQEAKLKRATQNALKLANEKGITQLALPPVGTGFYQVDLGLCARVMMDTVNEHLKGQTSLTEVLFVGLDTREHKPFAALIEQGG